MYVYCMALLRRDLAAVMLSSPHAHCCGCCCYYNVADSLRLCRRRSMGRTLSDIDIRLIQTEARRSVADASGSVQPKPTSYCYYFDYILIYSWHVHAASDNLQDSGHVDGVGFGISRQTAFTILRQISLNGNRQLALF